MSQLFHLWAHSYEECGEQQVLGKLETFVAILIFPGDLSRIVTFLPVGSIISVGNPEYVGCKLVGLKQVERFRVSNDTKLITISWKKVAPSPPLIRYLHLRRGKHSGIYRTNIRDLLVVVDRRYDLPLTGNFLVVASNLKVIYESVYLMCDDFQVSPYPSARSHSFAASDPLTFGPVPLSTLALAHTFCDCLGLRHIDPIVRSVHLPGVNFSEHPDAPKLIDSLFSICELQPGTSNGSSFVARFDGSSVRFPLPTKNQPVLLIGCRPNHGAIFPFQVIGWVINPVRMVIRVLEKKITDAQQLEPIGTLVATNVPPFFCSCSFCARQKSLSETVAFLLDNEQRVSPLRMSLNVPTPCIIDSTGRVISFPDPLIHATSGIIVDVLSIKICRRIEQSVPRLFTFAKVSILFTQGTLKTVLLLPTALIPFIVDRNHMRHLEDVAAQSMKHRSILNWNKNIPITDCEKSPKRVFYDYLRRCLLSASIARFACCEHNEITLGYYSSIDDRKD